MKKILEKHKFVLLFCIFFATLFMVNTGPVDTSPPEVSQEHIREILDFKQVRCLAHNIFYESNGEPLAGQLAVAQITLNRARDSGKSLCSVVYEKKQFSWTEKLPRKLGRPSEEAYNLAQEVLLKGYADRELENAYFFHTKDVKPYWRKKFKFIKTIGNHKIYGKEPTDA
jgi:N-acetylmuramoyl-L-alanine amidase